MRALLIGRMACCRMMPGTAEVLDWHFSDAYHILAPGSMRQRLSVFFTPLPTLHWSLHIIDNKGGFGVDKRFFVGLEHHMGAAAPAVLSVLAR